LVRIGVFSRVGVVTLSNGELPRSAGASGIIALPGSRSRDIDDMHIIYAHHVDGAAAVSRKVRKTLNIDAAKLKRAKQYLGLDTETEVIDHLLDQVEYERQLNELLAEASPSWKSFRSPLARRRRRR
jgi:hypothetical protein